MADRSRVRVGRDVTYYPTDAQAATGNGSVGDAWPARITKVNGNGSVNLFVHEADGTTLALTSIQQSTRKGGFDLHGGVAHLGG